MRGASQNRSLEILEASSRLGNVGFQPALALDLSRLEAGAAM
jgi:hypothetical protein